MLNTRSRDHVAPSMNRRVLGLVVCVLLGLSAAAYAAAPKKSATETLRDANAHLRAVLAKQKPDEPPTAEQAKQITTDLRELFDIAQLTERALVDHWKDMTAEQRTEIVSTLRAIVEQNYISQLRSNLDYQIDYTREEKQGDEVVVHTVIRAKKNGRPTKIKVDYLLAAEGASWRVVDVITEDVSILENYRSQFNRIIAKDGVPGLLKRMKAKLPQPAK